VAARAHVPALRVRPPALRRCGAPSRCCSSRRRASLHPPSPSTSTPTARSPWSPRSAVTWSSRPAAEVRRCGRRRASPALSYTLNPAPRPAPGRVVARGLLQTTSGLQLNGTRLDESLLSNLAAVVAGLSRQLEASTALLAASVAQQADQTAAIENVTSALAGTQVRREDGAGRGARQVCGQACARAASMKATAGGPFDALLCSRQPADAPSRQGTLATVTATLAEAQVRMRGAQADLCWRRTND